ncbi:MAG: hypothetical protein HC880_02230 [Bacteroidia bacterium]|nr:hypothetical protein [Bacteroidia bacterium]
MIFESRLSKGESFFVLGNNRFSLGATKLPIVSLRYSLGLKDFMGGDFQYHKFAISFEQDLRLGVFGRTYYLLNAQYIPTALPYPILKAYLANEGFFYNFYGFNLMNYLEFINDRHISLNYEHTFNGVWLSRLPLLKKLKLRPFVASNVLYGSLRPANQALIPATDTEGNALLQPQGLGQEPYIEVGYGISNILRLGRITLLHRLTYRDAPGVRNFGVFFSTRFEL